MKNKLYFYFKFEEYFNIKNNLFLVRVFKNFLDFNLLKLN